MAIYRNSRYTKVPLLTDDGVSSFQIRPLQNFAQTNATVHIVREGDSLDMLATKYYGTPELYWVILDNNKRKIRGVLDALVPGTQLIIPDAEVVRRALNV